MVSAGDPVGVSAAALVPRDAPPPAAGAAPERVAAQPTGCFARRRTPLGKPLPVGLVKRLVKATADLATYIANNAAALPDYSERWFNGERISTAFVESTVNLVISRRFAKKQQMQWSKAGAHLLLQTRTKTLDGTLPETFRKWYPAMAANDTQMPAAAA